MAGDNAAEIDLYDNIDEDFVQEYSENAELYDDMIVPSKSESPNSVSSTMFSKQNNQASQHHTGRRVACYVGNLTWWTTDQDLITAANQAGIHDILEIKFHENRQNGQSKGFCVMVLGSDQSLRAAMEKIPKSQIHGQNPVVTHCNKQSLNMFEKAAGNDSIAKGRSDETGGSNSRSSNPTIPASLGFSLRNTGSLMGQAVPNIKQLPNPIPNHLQQALASQALQTGIHGQLSLANVLMTPSVPPPPLPGRSNLMPGFNLPSTLTTSVSGGSAHVNPNFIQQQLQFTGASFPNSISNSIMGLGSSNASAGVQPQIDNFGRPIIQTYTPSSGGKLSESEFEDILQRNKTVSSSAINRAVQDAASGDYASAIETLVTAISLIKQSKISGDDRCRILINSLQDTLHGIESKSYGTKSNSRRRRRSYSDSGSENGFDGYSAMSSSSGNRRHRDRSSRSRSRDRRDRYDRHRRSRDRGNSSSYYGTQSASSVSGGAVCSGATGSGSGSGASDRYRESRYRH